MQPLRSFVGTQPIALLGANVVGAILYVFAASRGGWAIPAERAAGIFSVTGEPFVWFTAIVPIVAIFFVINVTGLSFWSASVGWASDFGCWQASSG
jgi:hypothetical protein